MNFKELLKDNDFVNLDTIVRWDLNQVIKEETVSQHSFWVSLFSTCLAEELFTIRNEDVLAIKLVITRYALFHDLDEGFTGDVNHTVKNDPLYGEEIRKSLKKIIDRKVNEKFKNNTILDVMFKNYLLSDDALKVAKSVVKICDWASFLKYLENEKNLGNRSIEEVLSYCKEGMKKQIEKTIEILEPFTAKYGVNISVIENLI